MNQVRQEKRVLVVAIAVGASVLGDAMLYAVLPANIESFGLQVALVGVVLSANRFIRLFSNSWAAWTYERIGGYRPFMAALLVGGAITAGYGSLHGFWVLVLLRILWGVCFSFLRLGGYLAVLEGQPRQRGWLMGLLNTGFRGGQVIGSLLGAVLSDALGIPLAFPILAMVTGLSFVGMLWMPHDSHQRTTPPKTAEAPRPMFGFVEKDFKNTLWNLMVSYVPDMHRTIRFRLLAVNLTGFAVAFGLGGLLVGTLGFIFKEMVGETLRLGPLVIGITSITGTFLALRYASDLGLSALAGRISDVLGRAWLLNLTLPLLLLGLLAVGFATKPVLLMVALPVVFVAMTGAVVALDASAADIAAQERAAQVMSRYATWRDLGSALGPLLGFAAAGVLGLYAMYLLAIGLLAMSAVVYWVASKKPMDSLMSP
jgi:MFS family permease